MAGHIASASSLDWCTPPHVLDAVRAALGGVIHLDPCSNSNSLVRARVEYSLPDHDGLVDTWDFPTIFTNPPFGSCHIHQEDRSYLAARQFRRLPKAERTRYRRTTVADWIRRCSAAHREHGAEVIALVPAAVDTKVWHRIIFATAAAVFFPSGRIKFFEPPGQGNGDKPRNAPPMATALVYWGQKVARFSASMQRQLDGMTLDLQLLRTHDHNPDHAPTAKGGPV